MRVQIQLPEHGRILVASGDLLDFSTPIFSSKTETQVVVQITSRLRIRPEKIFSVLQKSIGDSVKEHEVIAQKKGWLGSDKILIESSGVIKEICHEDGTVVISGESADLYTQQGGIKGEVVSVDAEGVTVLLKDARKFDLLPVSDVKSTYWGGSCYYLDTSPYNLTIEQISGKVNVVHEATPYILTKCDALGGVGVVTGQTMPKHATFPCVQLQNSSDFEKIIELKKKNCTVDVHNHIIYFYNDP